jgi:energy-coupling factor transporter ATP-binding protein EcfA2
VTDTSTFFEQFNAKYLDPQQVAAGYVYSGHFDALSGPYNAVLVGPRGSGKTTLLKMLQPAALDAWTGPRAHDFRKKIDYSGVFIASDISWSRQLNSLGYGKLSEDNHRTLVVACFTTHVLQAVLETMIFRATSSDTFRSVKLSGSQEADVAKTIMGILKLTAPLATLLSVKQALRSRLSEIRQLSNRGSLKDQNDFRAELSNAAFLHLDFIDIFLNITGVFDDTANEQGAKWGLLFDELETAPDWIVGQLFSALRVSNPRMYLKLAISPVSATAYKTLLSVDGPADGQDYRQISLWYSDRVDAKGFCEAVWKSLTKKAGVSITARDALGPSAFEPVPAGQMKRQNPYAKGEYWHEVFTSLKRKDRSFAAFLRARNIDLERLSDADPRIKDSVLRKAAPIAAVRNFYLHEDSVGNVAHKQRKTSALYAGAESIFAISEGNPRWLIGLLTPMISYMVTYNVRKVPASVQSEEIESAAERLLALLRTIPLPPGPQNGRAQGLNGIVQKIGVQLHGDLMNRNFSLDPRLSFIVDRDVDNATVELLSSGLNRGAVILVAGTPARSVVGDMCGVALRLSYLLAAKYGLPLRKGKSTNLSLLLEHSVSPSQENETQLNLSGL